MHHARDFAIFFLIVHFIIGFMWFPSVLGSNAAQIVAGYETMLPIWKRAQ